MERKLMCSVIFAIVFCGRGVASGYITPEYNAVSSIARDMKLYQNVNQGPLPTSWEQLKQISNLDYLNKRVMYRQSYPIQDHYEFITKPMPFKSHGGIVKEGSQVLLLRTVPLENLSEPDQSKRHQWRYLIVRSKDGVISSTRLPESDIQAMLKSAGITITPKPGLPAVETDEQIPEIELKPQPNPNDVEFLKQHPELDPQRKTSVQEASKTGPVQSPRLEPTPTPKSAQVEQPAPVWPWLIGAALLLAVVARILIKFLRR